MIGWIFAVVGALLFVWAYGRFRAERARVSDPERQCERWARLSRDWEAASRDAARRIQGAVERTRAS